MESPHEDLGPITPLSVGMLWSSGVMQQESVHINIALRNQLKCDKWVQSGYLLQNYPIAMN